MFGKPKASVLRHWVGPSARQPINGDRSDDLSPAENEREANVKLAMFFTIVALLFVLAEHLGRVQEQTDSKFASEPAAFISLSLLPPHRSADGVGFSVRFRLSNKGNHALFYPIDSKTRSLNGEIVVRASPASDWIRAADTAGVEAVPSENSSSANRAWIEMPPGGWVDGVFQDTVRSQQERAYVLYVKPTRDGNEIRILSTSYILPPT